MKNQVQLITYPDSLGGNLQTLNWLLEQPFQGLFKGGVHILPPFPSSGDRGFAPLTYQEIEPRFGTWADLRKISESCPVLLDLMVNHISRQSPFFQDFQKRGRRSPYAGLFLTPEKVWPGGNPPPADLARIFLRRPEHPFLDVQIEETGEMERVWATFGTRDWSEQIDLDVNSPQAQEYFRQILGIMAEQGVKILRLDAIAFITKKAGTTCFFVEPDIYDFLDWIQAEAARVGLELLPELHAHYSYQEKLARHGSWVYNFVLPLLILHALSSGSGAELQEHLRICPARQFTMLDCHDGIPVQPDLDGILDVDSAQAVVQARLERGANLNRIYSPQHRLRPDFDAHQINCTYYSALDEDPDAYMAARAIQFFAPGIPQVYYVGLLAGENAPEEVERSGEKRAINRRNYSLEEVRQALEKPVVQRLFALIRFRNEYPAFQGRFSVLEGPEGELHLAWQREDSFCELKVDLATKQARIDFRAADGTRQTWIP
jgi:sucrose 6(F)-phosphate phosphorylase